MLLVYLLSEWMRKRSVCDKSFWDHFQRIKSLLVKLNRVYEDFGIPRFERSLNFLIFEFLKTAPVSGHIPTFPMLLSVWLSLRLCGWVSKDFGGLFLERPGISLCPQNDFWLNFIWKQKTVYAWNVLIDENFWSYLEYVNKTGFRFSYGFLEAKTDIGKNLASAVAKPNLLFNCYLESPTPLMFSYHLPLQQRLRI